MTNRPSKKTSPIGIDAILKAKIKERPPILINGVLPAGGGMIIAGESEVGKSLMRVEWSVLLALGLPIYGMKTPKAQTILVFQTENAIKQERFRTKQVMKGHGIESCYNRILYAQPFKKPYLTNDKFLRHAEQQVRESGATVIWWDPLVSFHCKNENDTVGMRNVLDCITYLNRQTNAASIIIHHFGKPASKKQDEIPLRYRMRGASSIRDWADTIITLRATVQSGNPGPGRILDYVKIRNGPSRPALYLERNGNFIHNLAEEQRKVPLLLVKEIIRDKADIIRSKNDLIKEIQEATGCSRGSAFNAINECFGLGYIWEEKVDGIKRFNASI